MPVIYYVSPDIAEDKRLDDIKTITLSYTFFEKESDQTQKSASLTTKTKESLQ